MDFTNRIEPISGVEQLSAAGRLIELALGAVAEAQRQGGDVESARAIVYPASHGAAGFLAPRTPDESTEILRYLTHQALTGTYTATAEARDELLHNCRTHTDLRGVTVEEVQLRLANTLHMAAGFEGLRQSLDPSDPGHATAGTWRDVLIEVATLWSYAGASDGEMEFIADKTLQGVQEAAQRQRLELPPAVLHAWRSSITPTVIPPEAVAHGDDTSLNLGVVVPFPTPQTMRTDGEVLGPSF